MDQFKIELKKKLTGIIEQIDNIKNDDCNSIALHDINNLIDDIDDIIYNKKIKFIKINDELNSRIESNLYFEKMFKDLSPFFLIYNIANNISNKNIIKNNV